MGFAERLEQMRREANERRQHRQEETDELATREFTGQDGDGYVRITVDGLGGVRAVRVDPAQLRTIQDDDLGRRVSTRCCASCASSGTSYRNGPTRSLRVRRAGRVRAGPSAPPAARLSTMCSTRPATSPRTWPTPPVTWSKVPATCSKT